MLFGLAGRSKNIRCLIEEHHSAQLHGRRLLFALHNRTVLAYININRREMAIPPSRGHRKKTMNPIRIARSWLSYRRTLNELGGLSNQTLSDIGVSRYDIRNIASRSFR
ncbi:uncharacterized protein YjiS (DUF1127 family) [Rhizobium leguminosarum]|nr:uncharacterized protein YjiS (DUF1127 family) [Rhizobium leguminosarum]